MSITLVQTKVTAASSSANPVTLAFTSNITAGNLLVITTVNSSGLTSQLNTPTGNSNTYTSLFNLATSFLSMQAWYVTNATGGATTVSFGNPNTDQISIVMREYSGIVTTTPLDQSHSAVNSTGTSTAMNSGATVATTNANDLVVGLFADAWGAGQTYTVGSGYADMTNVIDNGSFNVSAEDKTVVATGTQTATMTLGNAANWIAGVAAFKGVAGGTVHTQTNTGALSFVGAENNRTLHQLTASLSFVGAISRAVAHKLSASLSFAGTVVKTTAHTLNAAFNFAGTLVAGALHFLTLTASLRFSVPGTSCDYLTIQDSLATGAAYAGKNSVLVSNDTNWSVG